MKLNRFKELLESTMGNVKPLIMEQSVNQMVEGPFTFVRASNDEKQYYIYKQGKSDQESKFFIYHQDNPADPLKPDKLILLEEQINRLGFSTQIEASKYVRQTIDEEKRDLGGEDEQEF
jgi:hypothetical protein